MAEFDPSELPIVARLDEAQAIADNVTDTLTDTILAIVGDPNPAPLEIGSVNCTEIFLGDTIADRAMARIIGLLCQAMSKLIDGAGGLIGDLLAGASNGLNDVLDSVRDLVGGFEDSITSTITDIVATVTERLDASLRNIVGAVEDSIRTVSNFLGDLVNRIQAVVSDVLSGIGFAISELIGVVGRSFDALISATGRIIDRLDSTVRSIGEFLVELASSTLEQMSLTVAAVLGPLIGAGQSVLGRLGDLVESIPGALKDAAGAVAEGVGKFVGEPLGAIGSIFVTQVEEFFGAMVSAGNLSYGSILKPFFECFDIPEIEINKLICAADDAAPETPGFFVAALALMVPLMVFPIVGAALAPIGEQIQQGVNRTVKPTLIPAADLLEGFAKGDITEDFLRDDFIQAGYREDRIDMLLATSLRAPDPSVQIQAWLRGLIEENELDTALAQNRMRPEDITALKQIVFFVPPAQDLIQMAVREVFSPEVRERFGQDEDFPEEFAKFAAQQGISDEWARNYWAAHWALPSPAQGFEMLHRGVIEVADLDVLLRALDVMPFWREKLTQIAFSPLTRVDLRRMHGLGLLTDKDLQTRYEALGFNSDDASLMVVFTVAFNSSDDVLPEDLVGLTRASVLGMFADGIITRDDAVELIIQMGIGEDAAELYVEQRDLDISRKERSNLIESIIGLAGGGRINLSQAEDSLAQLGIGALEITKALGRILGLIDNRDRLPSLAALEKMHKKEIIDDDTFLDSIKALGFNDEWADREFALLTGQELA